MTLGLASGPRARDGRKGWPPRSKVGRSHTKQPTDSMITKHTNNKPAPVRVLLLGGAGCAATAELPADAGAGIAGLGAGCDVGGAAGDLLLGRLAIRNLLLVENPGSLSVHSIHPTGIGVQRRPLHQQGE